MQIVAGCEIRVVLSKEDLQQLLIHLGEGDEVVLRIPMEDALPLHEISSGYVHTIGDERRGFSIETLSIDKLLNTSKE